MLRWLLIVGLVSGSAQADSLYRFDPAFDSIVAANAVIEKLADSPPTAREPDTRDGPVWLPAPAGGYLLYTSLGARQINKFDPRTGTVTTYLTDTPAVGMTADRQGRIVWASGAGVVRLEKDGSRATLADGAPLNNPKDLVYKSDGTLFFTDPGHYPAVATEHPSLYSLKNGSLKRLASDPRINSGLAFSPDEKFIYLSGWHAQVLRFAVLNDGSLGPVETFIDMETLQGTHPEWPDAHAIGIKVDVKGNVYAIGPGGIWVLSPAGKPLGAILGMNRPANLAFGGADGKTLYVTSRPGLYKIDVRVAGVRR